MFASSSQCKLDFQHLDDVIICRRRIIGELRFDGRKSKHMEIALTEPGALWLHFISRRGVFRGDALLTDLQQLGCLGLPRLREHGKEAV